MLVLVLVCAVGAILGLRRVMKRTRIVPGNKKVLRLIDALPLGPRRFVYVVDLQGRTLVLGAGGEEVRLLAEYGEDEWGAEMNLQNPLVAEAKPAAAPAAKKAGGKPTPARTPPSQAQPEQEAGAAADTAATRRPSGKAANGSKRKQAAPPKKPSPRSTTKTRRAAPAARAGVGASGRLNRALQAYKAGKDIQDVEEATAAEAALGPGAERVPPAFRHLLKKALEEEGRGA